MTLLKRIGYAVASVLLLAIIYISSQTHLRRAFYYYTADIDDYKIFENRVVESGEEIKWAISPDYNKKDFSPQTKQAIEAYQPVAWVIIQNGELLMEKYWENYSDTSYSNSFSMAKSVVALMIGVAIEEGKIKSVQDKVSEYVTEYKQGARATLTIEQVLTMSSGLNWEESYGNPFSMTTKAYYGDNITPLVLGLEMNETPGQKFNYLSGNTQLLALILERATGKKLADYVSEKLWKPLGASRNALWCLDKENGTEKSYCCLNSNARDFARIGQMILDSGRFAGKEIIPQAYLQKAITPFKYANDTTDFYGYQIWIANYKGEQIPYLRGILGQYIFIIPSKKAVIVRLGMKRSKEKRGEHPEDVFLYLEAAMEVLN
jgi:CubicO group peptidase (beta-lactamase class C family)